MNIRIRCREDQMYQFVHATPNVGVHGLTVVDRECTEHFFPFENMIHVAIRMDDMPKERD